MQYRLINMSLLTPEQEPGLITEYVATARGGVVVEGE